MVGTLAGHTNAVNRYAIVFAAPSVGEVFFLRLVAGELLEKKNLIPEQYLYHVT